MKKAERDIVLYYLNNLVKHSMPHKLEDKICDWFEENSQQLIGKEIEDRWANRNSWRFREKEEQQLLPRCCKTIIKLLDGNIWQLPEIPMVSAIIEAFHISPKYHEVLTLRILIADIPLLNSLVDACDHIDMWEQIMSYMLNRPSGYYEKFFSPTCELKEKGLFGEHNRRHGNKGMNTKLAEVLEVHCKTPETIKRIMLGKPQKATLTPAHFEHLQEEYDCLRNLLGSALKKKQRGVNILIYGKPGTGKTELAKTLCKELGTSLYAVSDNLSSERQGAERRSELAAAISLLQDDKNSVLLMDEAEDVFGVKTFGSFMFVDHSVTDSKSKLFFNRLLETNAVPVIWVSNSVRGVDSAHLRRFSYALNMEAPDETVQHRIWNYSARKNKVKLPKGKIDKLSKTYDIAPAIIDASLRTAALTGDHTAIEKTIESLQTVMNGKSGKKEYISEHEFSTALLNCDTDLEKLSQRIMSLNGVNFSLCLYGAPGTGKSAYARFLAEKLKMKVLHKRASDLMSMWLGGSEKNIAAAFAEAKKKKMLLVFDEVDSFLQDRRNATKSWEVSQVNEMLTQMESHSLPFVCTTNLMEGLDRASLRRFTFKVKYDYLTASQVETAFKHFFGTAPTVSLRDLTHLAPGDFAVVTKKATITGTDDPKELAAMLRLEQDVKEVKGNPIGFGM